jgi:asparagine synthase (glutamine-hydrolysing)
MTDILPVLARHYGEPFGDSSALPSYYVSRETRKHVTVALNGDGGDENFGGYNRYQVMKLMSVMDGLPQGIRQLLGTLGAGVVSPFTSIPLARKAKRFFSSVLPSDDFHRYLTLVGIFFEVHKNDLYTQNFKNHLDKQFSAPSYLKEIFKKAAKMEPINKLLYVDFKSYLPECLMAKMDIATMANSLEGRSPFLDHDLVEYVFGLPSAFKLKGFFNSKWILKKSMREIIPENIQQRKKMGFGIPLGSWFRNELREYWKSHVLSENSIKRGYFEKKYLLNLFDEHISGKYDHGYRMWNLLMLELWHQMYAPSARLN